MGYSWFLKLAFSCIDHFAWPLLALGYPLCASVQAIETDSYSETRDLISYWILLTLIYLFEYAFLRLLSWFQFWPYIKLMIIFWLIIPDFGRASYVYNSLVRSFISMKPQAVITKLKTWRKLFAKKENFLLHAERYIQENGTEDLEKLIANKITTHNPDAEATNSSRATDKKETQQIAKHNPDAEATNTSRAIDKKEMQQMTTHNPDVEATNSSRATDKKETQQITTHNPDAEATNTSRATDKKEAQQTNGKKLQMEHKDIKDLEVIDKKEISAGKQDIPFMPKLSVCQNISSAVMENNGLAGRDTAGGELPQSSTHKEVQKEWTCALCQVTTTSEKTLNIHLHGKKHKATCKALKAKDQSVSHTKGQKTNSIRDQKGAHAPANKTDQPSAESKNGESIADNVFKGKAVTDHKKVQGLQKNLGKPVMMNNSKFRCEACNVNCTSGVDLVSHLNGGRHLAQIQSLVS